MKTPSYVIETINALRAERPPLGARLDAIDLALDNLVRVWPPTLTRAAPTRKKAAPPQPIRLVAGDSSAASHRRDVLLAAIGKSDAGLTLAELRKQTPKMDGKDRSNALQQLKAAKQIRRAGNAWVKAA